MPAKDPAAVALGRKETAIKHTPGPWKIGTGDGWNPSTITTDDDQHQGIAQVYGIPLHGHIDEVPERQDAQVALATARLIVASPDLLEALEELFNGTCFCSFDPAKHTHHSRGCVLAVAALAKAKGETV